MINVNTVVSCDDCGKEKPDREVLLCEGCVTEKEKEAYDKGMEDGEKEGYDKGKEEGYDQGLKDGENNNPNK